MGCLFYRSELYNNAPRSQPQPVDSSHTYRSSTSTKGQTLFLLHQVVGKKHLNTYSSLGRDTGAYFLNSVVLITVSYIVQSSVI